MKRVAGAAPGNDWLQSPRSPEQKIPNIDDSIPDWIGFIIKSRPINLSQRTTKDLLWAEACFVLTDDRCFLLYTPLLACLSTSLVQKEYWDNWTYHSDGFSWVWPNFLLNTNILHFEQQWGKFSKGGDTDSLGLLFIRFYCRKESVLTMIIILIVFFICCNHGGD